MKHMNSAYRQQGFSLVELMIALVVGLIITMGAGQLFLTGLQNYRQVELLGNKQAALTFAAEMVIRDIRRADNASISWDASGEPDILTLAFTAMSSADGCSAGELVERDYYVSGGDAVSALEGWSLVLKQWCDGVAGMTEPLVTGFGPDGQGLAVDSSQATDGIYTVTFCLINEPGDTACDPGAEGLTFHAVNRTAAVVTE